MEIVKDQIIEGESVTIDDKIFIDCLIVDCTLEYSGRAVAFERTYLRRCRYVFFGRAQRTILFLQETGLMPYGTSSWSDHSETVN